MIREHMHREDETRRAPSILLAADDPQIREKVASLMEQHGCEVVTCPDGLRLLDALNTVFLTEPRVRFDVILCDLHLTGVNAVGLLRGMQDFVGFPPTVLMSAGDDDGLKVIAHELGAAAIIPKPVDGRELIHVVDDLLPPDCLHLREYAA